MKASKYLFSLILFFVLAPTVFAITPITPIEVTPGSTGFQDVDVTANVGSDAGNIAGVILEIVNTDSSEFTWGIRKNGSTDNITGVIEDTGHTWAAIGTDSSDIFEASVSDTTNIDIYLVAYIIEDEGTFLTNAVTKTSGTSFTDIDISGDTTGDDVATSAFFLLGIGSNLNFGLRENGSTDDRIKTHLSGDLRGAMMSVDVNEILEGKFSVADPTIHFVGYLIDNFTSFTNAKNHSAASSGSYIDVDFSADIPAGNNGAFWQFVADDTAEYKADIEKNGLGNDHFFDITEHQYGWVEIDSDRIADQKVESTNMDLYLWGFSNTLVAAVEAVGGTPNFFIKGIVFITGKVFKK